MSKRAIININGESNAFDGTMDKLKTPGIGGSDITWVPDEQTRCEVLNVTANGTYNAATAGKYGYDYVTVSVAGSSVTGKKSDGKTHNVSVDPETGELVDTVVPAKIRVTTLPSNLIYHDGDEIDFTGIVVHAYDDDDVDMGEVPFEELGFPTTHAEYDDAEKVYGMASSDLSIDQITQPIQYTDSLVYKLIFLDTEGFFAVSRGKIRQFVYVNEDNANLYILNVSETGGSHIYATNYYSSGIVNDMTTTLIHNFTHDGKTVYWSIVGTAEGVYPSRIPEINIDPYSFETQLNNETLDKIAWTILYGEGEESGGHVKVPVQWIRPGDGEMLETEYEIWVLPEGGEEAE